MEPAQSTKLQTDDSSSSSPSSGSDDDFNTGMQQVALAGQQESLDERPPASSSELDLEEEFQIQQHHSTTTATAPLGYQQAEINIVGGDFRGAQIVGSQTTHQQYNLTKQEFIDQRQIIHQTINVLQQQPESFHPAASQHQEQTSGSDKKIEKKVISSGMKETEDRIHDYNAIFKLSCWQNQAHQSTSNMSFMQQSHPKPRNIKEFPSSSTFPSTTSASNQFSASRPKPPENEDKHKHDVAVNITSVSGDVSVSFSEDKADIMLKGQSKVDVKQKGGFIFPDEADMILKDQAKVDVKQKGGFIFPDEADMIVKDQSKVDVKREGDFIFPDEADMILKDQSIYKLEQQQQLKNIKAVKHGVHQSEKARLLILSSSSAVKMKKRYLETHSESSHSLQKSRGDSFASKSSARAFRKSKSEAQFSSKHLVDDPYETNPDKAVAENKNYNPNALIKQRHEMTMLGLNIKEGKKERLQKWLQDPNTPSQAFSVGHEGGVIELKDCKVTFDVGTFDDFATVWVTEEVDSSKWPAGYIGISPMLYLECDREILKPVNIEMTTWCVSDGSDKGNRVKAEILHKADGDTKWKSLDNFPLPLNPLVEFKCQDFSPILVAIRNFFLGNQKFPISGFLYVKGDDEFHSGFFLKNETLETKMEGKLKKLGGEVKLYYNTMVLEMNDTVHLEFSCESESFRFQPADGSSFNINTDFVRLKHDTILYSVLQKANNSTVSGNNKFYVTANVRENDNPPRSYPFSHQWQSQDVAETALLSQSPSVAHSPPDHPDSKTATGQEGVIQAVVHAADSSSASLNPGRAALSVGANASSSVYNIKNLNYYAPSATSAQSVVDPATSLSQPDQPSTSGIHAPAASSVSDLGDDNMIKLQGIFQT